MIALMGFLYTPSTANAELQQGTPETSHPTIHKQKHLQEIGQVAQRQGNRPNVRRVMANKVQILRNLDASCKRGSMSACMRFGRFSERYPNVLKKMRIRLSGSQVSAIRQARSSKMRMLTRINTSCNNGDKRACNRFAKFSKLYPGAASKVRTTRKAGLVKRVAQVRRQASSKVRMLKFMDRKCKFSKNPQSRSRNCDRFTKYSKRYPSALRKAGLVRRVANLNRQASSKVRMLRSMDNSCRTLKNAQSRSRACNRFSNYAAKYVRAMFK
jgi:hypothetical protein